MKVELSEDTLRGLDLALWAAHQGHSRVVLSNNALQEWLGKEKVHEGRIKKLAQKLTPTIFNDYEIPPDRKTEGHRLILYLNKKSPKAESVPVLDEVASIESICKKLGIELKQQ